MAVAGITSGTGSLTLGLTQQKITAIQGMPGAIQMAMNRSGQSIQTAGGTTAGYAQGLVTSTVTVNTGHGLASASLPTVFDTGGGPNGVIYYSGSSADPELFRGVINSGSSAGFSLDYQGNVFDAWSGSSPWGGEVKVISSMSPDVNRVNTGGYLFQNYVVMVDLDSATLTLAPVAVPEPATLALLATGLAGLLIYGRAGSAGLGAALWAGRRRRGTARRSPASLLGLIIAAASLLGGREALAQAGYTSPFSIGLAPDIAAWTSDFAVRRQLINQHATPAQNAWYTTTYTDPYGPLSPQLYSTGSIGSPDVAASL